MATRRFRTRNETPSQRRAANLRRRYGLIEAQYQAMLTKQRNLCALCGNAMKRPVVDHDHQTGEVRGILCHPCNIKLPVVEDMGWVMLAWGYLEGADE